jgi:hypothetical protein
VSCCPECSLITTCCSPQKGLNYKPGQDGLQEDNPANNIPAAFPAQEKRVELLTDIRNFVALVGSVDGRASTQEILAQFSKRLSPGSSPLFKFMLSEVCEFHHMSSGEGVLLYGNFVTVVFPDVISSRKMASSLYQHIHWRADENHNPPSLPDTHYLTLTLFSHIKC